MGILPAKIKSPGHLLVALAVSVAGVGWLLGWWPVPPCPFHHYLGVSCPMCGSTRACYAVLAGNFLAAFRFNPLFWYWTFWCVVAYLDVWVGAFSDKRPTWGTRLLLVSMRDWRWRSIHLALIVGCLVYLNFYASR